VGPCAAGEGGGLLACDSFLHELLQRL
jgi:hypothetical protein